MHATLAELRDALTEAQNRLIEAEADLADRLAEINAFELEFEARVGQLIDQLEALHAEIQIYNERIQIARSRQVFGQAHIPVENQYRRTWHAPPAAAPTPPPQPPPPATEAAIKKLYRQLARRFHPDLAASDSDRARRTETMKLVNDAYAARSLAELVALANQPDAVIDIGRGSDRQTEAQLMAALRAELERCQQRLRQIDRELRSLHTRPSVEVSLEVKAARRQGRDLLAEMAAELEQKIARKSVERDLLKAQFDQLGPDAGFIPINR